MNAKEELLEITQSKSIVCAQIFIGSEFDDDRKEIRLKKGYTSDDFNHFLEYLNFSYDNGFGCQELFGIVWLTKNEWLERGEYDGSEWWEIRSYPKIPDVLGEQP